MSNVIEREGCPLMEKPQPQTVPQSDPDSPPPSYSSLLGSQSQAYVPVQPSAPVQTAYSEQIVQNVIPYSNPMSQVTRVNGKPNPQPGFNFSHIPTAHEPAATVPPVNQFVIPNPTIVAYQQAAIASSRAKGCRYLTISIVICGILVAIAVGVCMHQRTQRNKTLKMQRELENQERRERERQDLEAAKKLEETQLEMINRIMQQNNQYFQNRYRRMVRADEIERFKDYAFLDSIDQSLLDKLPKSNKSYRQRRDAGGRIKAGTKKVKVFTKKKCLRGSRNPCR